MSTNNCSNHALFQHEIGPALDTFVAKLFKDVDKKVNTNFANLRIVNPDNNLSRTDIDRQLKNALFGSFTDSLNPKFIADIKSKLAQEFPCNSKQLSARLKSSAPRDVEEDLALLIAYGYQHGLAESDLRHLPANKIEFEFHASRGFESVALHGMNLKLSASSKGKYLSNVRSSTTLLKSGTEYKKIGSSEEEFIKHIITIGIPLLFECLKWLFEKLVDALKSGDDETIADALDDAIDKAEDVLEDVEEEIDDIKDEIKDLKEEIKELEEELKDEDDADDQEELKEEIKEKKDEKKQQEKKLDEFQDAEKELEKGVSRLKEARQKLR